MSFIPKANDVKMRQKLLLSYLLSIILPLLVIGSFFIANTKDIVLNYISHINEITTDQVKTNIVNELDNYIKISDNVLLESKLVETLSRHYESNSEYLSFYTDDVLTYINRMLLVIPDSVKISFFTTNNTVVPDNNIVLYADENVKIQEWYKSSINAMGANIISVPYIGKDGGKYFSISRTLSFSGYNNVTVMRIEIPLEKINDLIKDEGKTKNLILVSSDNLIFTLSIPSRSIASYSIGDVFDYDGQKAEDNENRNYISNVKELASKGVLRGWKLVSVISSEAVLQDINKTIFYSLVICLITVMITIVLIILFSYKLTGRLRNLANSMIDLRSNLQVNNSLEVVMGYEGGDEIGELSRSFKEMIDRINALISEAYLSNIKIKDLELEKKKAELHALQSQINPHFMFNTMESISMNLLNKGDIETCEIIRSFSKMLRRSIEWGNDITTLKSEMDFVWDYMKIQKFRHKDKIKFKITIDQNYYDIGIPKFVIQPIVENSIYHGLELKEGPGLLNLYTRLTQDALEIVIEDNGLGIKPDLLNTICRGIENGNDIVKDKDNRKSIGLDNINQRLRLYYGEEYGLSISSLEGIGTTVIVKVPLNSGKGDIIHV